MIKYIYLLVVPVPEMEIMRYFIVASVTQCADQNTITLFTSPQLACDSRMRILLSLIRLQFNTALNRTYKLISLWTEIYIFQTKCYLSYVRRNFYTHLQKEILYRVPKPIQILHKVFQTTW